MVHTIIGLGNPGKEYEKTRHNLGARVVEELAQRWQVEIRQRGRFCLYTETCFRRRKVLLVKPTAYMNLSGLAWLELAERFDIALPETLVICDDLNLPLGRLRIRLKGSDGGHQGLASILRAAGTEEVPRLRLGIGLPAGDWVDFVLSPFQEHERPLVERLICAGADAVETVIAKGIVPAMDQFNRIQIALE